MSENIEPDNTGIGVETETTITGAKLNTVGERLVVGGGELTHEYVEKSIPLGLARSAVETVRAGDERVEISHGGDTVIVQDDSDTDDPDDIVIFNRHTSAPDVLDLIDFAEEHGL